MKLTTLKHLQSVEKHFGVGISTVKEAVREVCLAIQQVMDVQSAIADLGL